MKKVLIIVGHQNIENLTAESLRDWRSVEILKRSTGASGERDYFNNKVTPLLKTILEKSGVDVVVVDGIYHEDVYSQDYDLCIAMHYDGGGAGNRCIAESPNETINPPFIAGGAVTKSDNFIKVWAETYPADTGVTLRQDLITGAMYDYYCWDYISENTPAVIIEHFNHTSPRGEELKAEPGVVAEADAKAILSYFGISTPGICVQLQEDIPTQVEDIYELKTYEWYSKYWTADEFIKDSIRVHADFETSQENLEKKSSTLEWTEEQLKKSIKDEAQLRIDLGLARKDASKLRGDIIFKDKEISTLKDERTALKTDVVTLGGVVQNLSTEIHTLKEENLILTNVNSSLEVWADEIIETKFTEWLAEQNWKTKMKYIFKILKEK